MNIQKESLGKLKCASCNLPLSVGPVTINADNTFVCGRCFNEGALVVTIYETLAQASEEAVFPCQYESYGCKENLKWGFVKEHEENCPNQPYNCPAIPCGWRGAVTDIANHFKETHHDDYISETNTIKIRLDEDQQYRKIIKTKRGGEYIFFVLFNRRNLLLNFTQLTNLKEFKKHQYKVRLYVNTEKHLTLGPVDVESYCTLNTNAFENMVDVDVLNYLNNADSSIFCKIMVHEKKSHIIIDLALLSECPYCRELMNTYCDCCIMSLTIREWTRLGFYPCCPLCNVHFSTIRNYAVGTLVDN